MTDEKLHCGLLSKVANEGLSATHARSSSPLRHLNPSSFHSYFDIFGVGRNVDGVDIPVQREERHRLHNLGYFVRQPPAVIRFCRSYRMIGST